jgi:hypothetical protein
MPKARGRRKMAVLFDEDGRPKILGQVAEMGRGGAVRVRPRGNYFLGEGGAGPQTWSKRSCVIFDFSREARRVYEGK